MQNPTLNSTHPTTTRCAKRGLPNQAARFLTKNPNKFDHQTELTENTRAPIPFVTDTLLAPQNQA
jgi:hypothetical protein